MWHKNIHTFNDIQAIRTTEKILFPSECLCDSPAIRLQFYLFCNIIKGGVSAVSSKNLKAQVFIKIGNATSMKKEMLFNVSL